MSESAIARRAGEETALRARLTRIADKAAGCIEGLYEPASLPDGRPNPDYNPDATVTWAECSMRTRASLVIHKATEGKQEADLGRAFGLVILTARAVSAATWEQQAREVDEAERQKAAIDVEAVVVKP